MIIHPILVNFFNSPLAQGPEPRGTQQFFEWYFYGLGGIGGWLIFMLIALAAVIWLLYDSQKRHIPAIGWRMGIILLLLLLLPTILYRFTVTAVHYRLWRMIETWGEDCRDAILQQYPQTTFTTCEELLANLPPMTPYAEYVFYLGLMGGVLAPILAIGYYVTYQGMIGCIRGHEPYEVALGRCPVCAAEEIRLRPPPVQAPIPGSVRAPGGVSSKKRAVPLPPQKPVISYAHLLDLNGNRRYDLCEGTTQIGRNPESDIYLTDLAVSRPHAFIKEQKGHFTITNVSEFGTLLNNERIRSEKSLQNGDRINVGDTVLQFVNARG